MSHLPPRLSLFVAALLLTALSSQAQDVTGISLFRTADYEQLADAEPLPVAIPFNVQAGVAMSGDFLNDPDNLIFVRGVTLQPPSGSPLDLDFQEAFGGFVIYAGFITAPHLEHFFPAGNYRFTFGSFISGDTAYDLSVPDATLLAPARVVNFAAAQRINPAQDFTLQWTPPAPTFSGARLRVVNATAGFVVFDSGSLPGPQTTAQIPAGTLIAGQEYLAKLSLIRLDFVDQNSFPTLIAGSEVGTTLPLKPGTGVIEPDPSRFTSITLNGSGDVVFTLECTPGVALSLQQASSLGAAWETVQTVTPDTSPVTLTLPSATLGQAAFFQAVQ